MRFLTVLVVILAVSACTTIPEPIQGTYTEVTPARVDPAVFGSTVRWGGVILDSKYTNDATCFEVLSRDLDKYLRPKLQDSTSGRYIACKSGFHDPAIFAKGREVTMTGPVEGIEVRKLDDFDYRYPVMAVNDLVLWQKRREVIRFRTYNDSFYNPWYWGGPYYYGRYPYWGAPYGGMSSGYAETQLLRPNPAIIESGNSQNSDDR